MHKVTIKEVVWKIVRWPPVSTSPSTDSRDTRAPIPVAPRVGLEFTSSDGRSLFLSMSGSEIPTDAELKAASAEKVAKWMLLARE